MLNYKIKLTIVICAIKSKEMPTEIIRITAGIALSFNPIHPINPKSSITFTASTNTMMVAAQGLSRKTQIDRNIAASTITKADKR